MVTTCPRGFKWSEKKLKCVPEGKEAKDKLMLKNERYFFKEDENMKEKCKPGYRWCSKTNKCIEDTPDKLQGKNLGRGQGEGPMGKPFKEASDLVDLAFDEGFETFVKFSKASKKANKILDLIQNECGCGCGDGEGHMGMHDEEGEEDQYEDAYDAMDHVGPNDIDAVPDQDGEKVYASIRRQLGEIRLLNRESKEEYRKFFQSMLNKYGVDSPSQLDDAKKKEFFNAVDRGWKTKKENIENQNEGFKTKMAVGSALAGYGTAVMLKRKRCKKKYWNDPEKLSICLGND